MKRLLVSIALLAGAGTSALAHDVPVEQIVQMHVQIEASQLRVRLHVPTALLADADLPKTADGHLTTDGIEPALRIVAADVARNLEFEQDDSPLPARVEKATLSAPPRALWNQAAVDLELTYALAPGPVHVSARVNTFRSAGQVVRTIAVFTPASGPAHTLSLTGDPERVAFDPERARVARDFLVRGFRALTEYNEWLLFLACLALPLRPLRAVQPAIAAFLAGQSIALVAGAASASSPADVRVAVELTMASAVVVAALRNLAGATVRWLWPLALGIGALTGFLFGQAFRDVAMFAGSHTLMALAMFAVAIIAAQAWAGAIAWAAVGVALRFRLPERIATIVTAIVVAHTAIHGMVDQGDLLAQSSSMTAEHMLALLTVAWAALILGAGMYNREAVR